jgi:nucleoside 2-deoxyribosyltransferase
MSELKVYIAGKVSKESVFKTHHWRDDFCRKIEELSGYKLENLDPLKSETSSDPKDIFVKDCKLINQSDIVIVCLSDDISVGGSQEILIARYLGKPVIGLAPFGGKFNGCRKEMLGKVIENYQDPFVFSTCDFVCGTIEEVAQTLQAASIHASSKLRIIDDAIKEIS